MADVFQGTLNPRVTPGWIVRRHPNHQRAEVRPQSGTAATDAHIRPLARDELAMPSKNGVRRHDGRDLPEYSTPKSMSQLGEAAALAVI